MNDYPIKDEAARKYCVDVNEQCPECGGGLDTGWECNDCGFDAQWIAYPQSERVRLPIERRGT